MSELRTYVEIDVDYDTTAEPPELDPPITYRYGLEAVDAIRADIDAVHNLQNVSFNAGQISLGEDLGVRTSVSVVFRDSPSYKTNKGTYWGRFRARHPYLQGRAFRLIQGLGDQPLAEMTTRHYVIDSFDGVRADGTFAITAKDLFKLADGEKAQAPVASTGRLAADIFAASTSATLEPAGVGDAEYPPSGIVALSGKELCNYTRAGDVLTLTRGQYNTDAQDHKADERVQLVLRYDSMDPALILEDLLKTYAGIDPNFIPLQEWLDETQNKLGQLYTGMIAEPTSVKALVSEIISQGGLAMWWDDIAKLLRLQVLAGLTAQPIGLDQSNIVAGTFGSQEQPDKRLSQVWTYYGQRNALEGQEDPDNYRSLAVTVDTQAETNYTQSAIRKIYSRWIPEQGRIIAESLNNRLLARFTVPPRRFSFSVFRKAAFRPALGEGRNLQWWTMQDADGNEVPALVELTRIAENEAVYQCQAEEILYTAPPEIDRVITIENNTFNVNLRTLHDQIFTAPSSGDTVICIINAGVTVGSIDTALPAFDVGSWPVSVEVIVQIRGRIQGKGGDGGIGEFATQPAPSPPYPPTDGGEALITTFAIRLDADQGEIWGGGGGGSPGDVPESNDGYSGSGGGGAGTQPGLGGVITSLPDPTTDGEDGTSEAGGAGGQGTSAQGNPDGGAGGNPGLAGDPGPGPAFPPGDPGAAINGSSLTELGTYDALTKTWTPGATGGEDIRGPEIN